MLRLWSKQPTFRGVDISGVGYEGVRAVAAAFLSVAGSVEKFHSSMEWASCNTDTARASKDRLRLKGGSFRWSGINFHGVARRHSDATNGSSLGNMSLVKHSVQAPERWRLVGGQVGRDRKRLKPF